MNLFCCLFSKRHLKINVYVWYTCIYIYLQHLSLFYHAPGMRSMIVLSGKKHLMCCSLSFSGMFINEVMIDKKTILYVIFILTNEIPCQYFWYFNDYVSIPKQYHHDSWPSDLWWANIPFQMYYHPIMDTATDFQCYHQVPLVDLR